MTYDADSPDDPDLQAALRLNRLHRFTKRSPQLVLEVHGSCEVPAGCGGVVLQWRDREGGAVTMLYSAWSGDTTVALDGAEVDSARVLLPEGEHRLTFRLEEGGMQGGLFAAALLRTEDDATVHATGTGLWRGRKQGLLGRFGDWEPLEPSSRDPETITGNKEWWFRSVVGRGAQLLEVPFGKGEVETTFRYVDPFAGTP